MSESTVTGIIVGVGCVIVAAGMYLFSQTNGHSISVKFCIKVQTSALKLFPLPFVKTMK